MIGTLNTTTINNNNTSHFINYSDIIGCTLPQYFKSILI